MQIARILTTLALLSPLTLAQTDSTITTPNPSQTSPPGDPTCPTITVTTGSTCPQITPVCIRPLCIEISTITQQCSCGAVPTVTSCETACGRGCAVSTSVAYLPCPVSPSSSGSGSVSVSVTSGTVVTSTESGTVTPTGTESGTVSPPAQTSSFGNGTVIVTPTSTISSPTVIVTGAAGKKDRVGKGGLVLGVLGAVVGLF
ncbi:hypothetical protein ONS96_011775 [Cadophora gregata f. sp. sojae]|nr:hypothetical protein ONS96_011775 [Cadophora gregata f. sp. sojae]